MKRILTGLVLFSSLIVLILPGVAAGYTYPETCPASESRCQKPVSVVEGCLCGPGGVQVDPGQYCCALNSTRYYSDEEDKCKEECVATVSMPGSVTITECCVLRHKLEPFAGDESLVKLDKGTVIGDLNATQCDRGVIDPKGYTANWAAYCTIDTVHTVSDWIFWIVFVVAAIIIVYAGFSFITSAGDPEKAGGAKKILFYGIIGVIVAVLAKFIPALARYFIGV